MSTPPLSMPSGFRCPDCGYDLSALVGGRCPECGLDVTNLRLVVHEERRALLARAGRVYAEQGAWWGGVLVVYSGGAGVLGRSIGFGVVAMVMLAIAALGSVALGVVASLPAPSWDRQFVRMVWVRRLWYVHAPWLSIAFGACVVWAVALAVSDAHGAVGVAVLVGLPIWVIGSLIAYAMWCARWARDLRALGVRNRRVVWAGALAALLVLGGAAIMGLLGGALAAESAMDWSWMGQV